MCLSNIGLHFLQNKECANNYWLGVMGVGSGGPCPLWIFVHGADIVDISLIMLFFGLFSVASTSPTLEEA